MREIISNKPCAVATISIIKDKASRDMERFDVSFGLGNDGAFRPATIIAGMITDPEQRILALTFVAAAMAKRETSSARP